MTDPFIDHSLSDQDRSAVHDFALQARQRLTREAHELLEGVYGLHASGTFEPPEDLPALKDAEAKATYERLKRHLEDETEAGLTKRDAVEKLIKEVAFTHLNRLVAFKMMEARKLIREAVGRGSESNGFKFYLAEHPEQEARWKRGDVGSTYQAFLLWQASQIAKEIEVLFDPENLASALFPRNEALDAVLDLINDAGLEKVWLTEDAIGWVYQYFNEPELQAAFAAVSGGEKFEAEDIPSATQLFTPRWIVRFLVENTLGRLWVQMHHDSELVERLRYLIPLEGELHPETLRPVKEIALLDPACGSMHFGLVAYDLFDAMYREELSRQGDPGWLAKSSIEHEHEIPAAILEHNLFGIDLDLRAVQLSALTIYIKAKTGQKDILLTEHNLACADILVPTPEHLEESFQSLPQDRPIYERLLREVWSRLADIKQLGSLLRLERDTRSLINAERERYEREGKQQTLFEEDAQFERDASTAEYWEKIQEEIFIRLEESVDALGNRSKLFVGETEKSLKVLDLLMRTYDVVVTNPPYMSRGKMNKTLADLLSQEYPDGKGDLFAAFILRCLELVKEHGFVGMLTMHSLMFISSYEKLRESVRAQSSIRTMAHLGPGLFATGNPGTLQTTSFVLQREPDAATRDASIGTYFRLVHEPDAETKQVAFEAAVHELQQNARKGKPEYVPES